MTVVISIPLGILAAVKHDRAADSHAEPLPRPSGRRSDHGEAPPLRGFPIFLRCRVPTVLGDL